MAVFLIPLLLIYFILSFVAVMILARVFRLKAINRRILLTVLILAPFAKEILINILFMFYSIQPLSAILETVEKPISIYWEDNTKAGFPKNERRGMVERYLDGYHLKLLVLNGRDGKYYVYRADESDYKRSLKIAPELRQATINRKKNNNKATIEKWSNLIDVYRPAKTEEDTAVIEKAQVFSSKEDIPSVNYVVKIDPLPSGPFVNSKLYDLIYADRLSIYDTNKKKEIAFSKRYMGYRGLIPSDDPSEFSDKIGYPSAMLFPRRVIVRYWLY